MQDVSFAVLVFPHDSIPFLCQNTQLSMKSNDSLNDLKTEITKSKSICKDGPILSKHQRLFHLGRELKTGNRTLSCLGIGRLSTVIHLFCTQPQMKIRKIHHHDRTSDVKEVIEVIDLSHEDNSSSNHRSNRTERNHPTNQSKRTREVIDLMDDSSDDEDNEIEIVDNSSSKRPRSDVP